MPTEQAALQYYVLRRTLLQLLKQLSIPDGAESERREEHQSLTVVSTGVTGRLAPVCLRT